MTLSLATVADQLEVLYPNATYELDWKSPFQLLIATILAAQCSDDRVNSVTPALFERFPTPRNLADAERTEVEDLIKTTGFYQVKAASIQEVSLAIADHHGGEVPKEMAALIVLPRVARKTANVVLTMAYNIASGIVVDAHVYRVAIRMGLSIAKTPEKLEIELMHGLAAERWIHFGPALILHGRRTCTNSKPKCTKCLFQSECPKIGVISMAETPKPKKKAVVSVAQPKITTIATTDYRSLPADWSEVLTGETEKLYYKQLEEYVASERATHEVFPPVGEVFTAFHLTPYNKVRVVILGQDPYHDNGQAHGLCFSVKPGITAPPSLKNMFKELNADLGLPIPKHGNLAHWAREGVLLINTVMTVRAHEANSHKDHGWETFTDAVIRSINARSVPVIFILWGGYAQKKAKLIDGTRHKILQAAHPSPLSVKKFIGSKPYSTVNSWLEEMEQPPIDWKLPEIAG